MKIRATKKHNERRRGAAAVELAFVFPIFMLLVLGIVEAGRFMMVGQLLTNTAREAARAAISGEFTTGQVQTDVENFMLQSAGITSDKLDIQITTESGLPIDQAATKELITVTVAVRFMDCSFLSFLDNAGGSNDPFWGLRSAHDNTKWMTGTSAMRKE